MKTASQFLPVNQDRARCIPATGFGWIDRRFFRGGYAAELSHPAIVLYAFLCSVANSTGHSWYGDAVTAQFLRLMPRQLADAKTELRNAGLALHADGIWRLLALPDEPRRGESDARRSPPTLPTTPVPIGDVLRRIRG